MNARGKKIDKTFLSIDNAEKRGFIHRDYISHCDRWSHAAKYVQAHWRDAVILDVGCGKEMPFPKMIYSSRMRPVQYIGLDVGEWPLPEMLEKATFPCEKIIGDIADVESYEDLGLKAKPNLIISFEVMEHVELSHCVRALTAIRKILAKDGVFMVSTPCWNGKDCADNHVNEMTYAAFGAMLEDSGFAISQHFGTFASQSDLKKAFQELPAEIIPGMLWWFEQRRKYRDSNVLSTEFASAFPQYSRNVIWDCIHADKKYKRQFPTLNETPKPWGSSQAQ